MKVETCRPVYVLFNVYEINCCVISTDTFVYSVYVKTLRNGKH